jgi:hypothetical protein
MAEEKKERESGVKPSAKPCGCDEGANHRCERHQREYDEMVEEAMRMNGW